MAFFITAEETVCALMGNWEARYEMAFSTGVIKMEGPYDDVNSLCKQWLQLTLPSMRWAVGNDARKKRHPMTTEPVCRQDTKQDGAGRDRAEYVCPDWPQTKLLP